MSRPIISGGQIRFLHGVLNKLSLEFSQTDFTDSQIRMYTGYQSKGMQTGGQGELNGLG